MEKAKHWVITGAGRGIGLELVKQLLSGSEQVTAVARNVAKSEALQALLREYPARLRVLEADVTEEMDLDRAVKVLEGQPVDFLVNNAGVYMDQANSLKDLDFKMVERTFSINAIGPMRVTKCFLPLLAKVSSPVIVNITSLMGSISDNGSGGSYSYRMSKAALNMFTKSLAIELPNAVVLSLHPGWVKTDMGGDRAPVSTSDSAAGLLKVIRKASTKESGQFFSYRGDTLSW